MWKILYTLPRPDEGFPQETKTVELTPSGLAQPYQPVARVYSYNDCFSASVPTAQYRLIATRNSTNTDAH